MRNNPEKRAQSSEKSRSAWGERIWKLLDGRPVTWLSEATGVGDTTLGSIIASATPKADNAIKIAQALGTTVEYLMTGENVGPAVSPDILLIPYRDLGAWDENGRPALKKHIPVPRLALGKWAADADRLWLSHMPPSNLPDCAAPGDLVLCVDPELPLVEGYYVFAEPDAADISLTPLFARRYRRQHHNGRLQHEIWDAAQAEPYFLNPGGDGGFIGGMRPVARILGVIGFTPAT